MIVVDTNVLLAGLMSSRGYSFCLIERMLQKKVDYLLSLKLFSEYWQTLLRHENLRKIPLSMAELETFMALVVQNATYQDVYYRWRPNLRDESDNFIIELAVAGNAQSVVTFNKKDFEETELKFDILIETPGDYLKRRKLL